MSSDDVEMSEEFYKHYSAAPVVAWIVTEESEELTTKLKELNAGSHVVTGDADNIADAFKSAYEWAAARHIALFKEEVEPAFKKFDKDGSGSIDKEELAALSKDLGAELNADQLTDALKDLDLNGDGVIDVKEFSRWYFTGMKPYNGTRRSLLKASAATKKIFDAVAEQAKNTLIGKELKMKKHSLTVGFNKPDAPGTHIEANVWFGGKSHVAQRNSLHAKYNDTSKESPFTKKVYDTHNDHGVVISFVEIRAKTSSADAATKHVEAFKKMMNTHLTDESHFANLIQVSADADYIVVGVEMVLPKSYAKGVSVPAEIQTIFEQVDQHITVELDLGTSLNDI